MILLLFVGIFAPSHVLADGEEEQNQISISVSPSDMLFDVDNIKPGDIFERTSVIKNDGRQDYYYQSAANQLSGSEKLYNQLDLTVLDAGEEVLYEGNLSDFDGFSPRFLGSGEEEEITYLAEFPWESGNEYQGLETDFSIVMWADAEPIEPGEPNEDSIVGGLLPQTGEEVPWTYYVIGIALIVLGGTALLWKQKRIVKQNEE